MDFEMITTRVATGALVATEDDVEALVAAGITHVVDCASGLDESPLLAAHPQISLLLNGMPDDGEPKPVSWFAKTLSFALPALAQPFTKVYLHCAAGVNRGPSNALAVLVAQGWRSTGAEALIRAARPQVQLAYKADAVAAVAALGYAK